MASGGRFEVSIATPRHKQQLWPMDLALLALTSIILILVFRYLRFDDTRWLYNAWTYLIAVPSIMIISSMLLRVSAGRFVERTLQVSFLLSVIIHLLLLVGAVNVVLFTRYWPDIFETMQAQSAPQKIKTPEFFTPTQSATRPEYLRPVQTEHEATESPNNPAIRNLSNARDVVPMPTSEQAVTPEVHPFIAPRPLPSPSQPALSSQAEALQRQELKPSQPDARQVDLPDLDPRFANPLQSFEAREEPSPRLKSSDAFAPTSMPETQTVETIRVTPIMPSRSTHSDSPEIAAEATELPKHSSNSSLANSLPQVPLDNRPSRSTASQRASIDAPLLDARLPRETPSRSESNRQANELSQKEFSQSIAATLPTTTLVPMNRPAMQSMEMDIVPGDTMQVPKRESAGGLVAETGSKSFSLHGPTAVDSRASTVQAPDPSTAMEASITKRLQAMDRKSDRSSTSSLGKSMTENDTDQPNWNVAKATDGMSPAKSSSDGPAILEESNSLAGRGGPLTRSELTKGLTGDRSTVPIQSSSKQSTSIADGARGTVEATDLESPRTKVADRDSRTTLAREASNSDPSVDLSNASQTSGMERASRTEASIAGTLENALTETSDQSIPSNPSRPRTNWDSERTHGLAIRPLEVPIVSNTFPSSSSGEGRGEPSESLTERDTRVVRDGASAIGNQLLDDTDTKIASATAVDASRLGLERIPRDTPSPQIEEGDLQTQRFRRLDVGGPTLAGGGVPLPAPAFQKRLDRTRDAAELENQGLLGPETEATIERGLEFLAAHQRRDGSWHLEDLDTKVKIRSDTAATGLAVLAFQGAGYTHQQGKYADVVRRALEHMISKQRTNGDLYQKMDPISDTNGWLYSHGIAALSLCEAYGMTQDPRLKEPAQQAVRFISSSQDMKGGGWRYTPGVDSDTSVTGWCMMALKSAQLSGLEVESKTYDGIKKLIELNQVSGQVPHLFRYKFNAPDTPEQRHGRVPTPTMTSVGLLLKLYFGSKRSDRLMQDGAAYLLKTPPAMGTVKAPARDTYYWYYATQVMFHMGGDDWKRWDNALRPLLIETQVRDGSMAGSWDPLAPIPDAWGQFGGRLYVTSLNLLSLEVNYRHLPLYEATAK